MSRLSTRMSVPPSDPRTLLRGRDLWWLGIERYYDFDLVVHRGREAIESGATYHAAIDDADDRFDPRVYGRALPQRFPRVTSLRMTAVKMKRHVVAGLALNTSNVVEIRSLFLDPERLIRTGYELIKETKTVAPAAQDVSSFALCLLGLGAVMYMEDRVCGLCFRCAIPGLPHCKIHSQSKRALDALPKARSEVVMACRRARQVQARLGWPQRFPYRLKRVLVLEYVIAGMLWPLTGNKLRRWNVEIEAALQGAPRVRALLPADFLNLSHADRLAALRRLIDPNEWVTQRWPTKVEVAEQWFKEEQRTASSGLRGLEH